MSNAIHIGLGVLLFSLVVGLILSERRAAQWKRRSEGRSSTLEGAFERGVAFGMTINAPELDLDEIESIAAEVDARRTRPTFDLEAPRIRS